MQPTHHDFILSSVYLSASLSYMRLHSMNEDMGTVKVVKTNDLLSYGCSITAFADIASRGATFRSLRLRPFSLMLPCDFSILLLLSTTPINMATLAKFLHRPPIDWVTIVPCVLAYLF